MIARSYEAVVFDLDGTLLTDGGVVAPRTAEAVAAVEERGIRVMIATGRSEGGVVDILASLRGGTPALVYNGAGLWCPRSQKLLEEQILGPVTVERTLRFARDEGLLPVVMQVGKKVAPAPRTPEEASAMRLLEDLTMVQDGPLPTERLLRITLFAQAGPPGGAAPGETPESNGTVRREGLVARLEAALGRPVYLTSFPLCALPMHRESSLQVIDVQPPSRGKGEALRVLEERYGIPAERVVAVGDADNDVPMLTRAGLGVAMENAMPRAQQAASRRIGGNNSDAIAELLEELFLS